VVFVAIQLFVPGSYLPPVFNRTKFWSVPPQIIISLPLQTALCEARAEGTLAMVVAIQLFVLGLYVPPVLKYWGGGPSLSFPPQTIISLPVHTAVCNTRAAGAFVVLVATQLSVLGLYFPPVFDGRPLLLFPPQTIISLPVHTAV